MSERFRFYEAARARAHFHRRLTIRCIDLRANDRGCLAAGER